MKKKEMAALFDKLGETACKSKVLAFGKLPSGLAEESLRLATLAAAGTFAFCASIADGTADEALEAAGRVDPADVLAHILRLAIDVAAEDAK